jgi:hypothetical protein
MVRAVCPAGKRAIGGGVEIVTVGSTLFATSSFPSEADNSWRTVLRSAFIVNGQPVRVYAVCVTQ